MINNMHDINFARYMDSMHFITSKFFIKDPQSIGYQRMLSENTFQCNVEFLAHPKCFSKRLKHRTMKFARFVIFQRTDERSIREKWECARIYLL